MATIRIEIPKHQIDAIARDVGFRQSLRNAAQVARNYRTMDEQQSYLDGVESVLCWLGPRQRRMYHAAVEAARQSATERQ